MVSIIDGRPLYSALSELALACRAHSHGTWHAAYILIIVERSHLSIAGCLFLYIEAHIALPYMLCSAALPSGETPPPPHIVTLKRN